MAVNIEVSQTDLQDAEAFLVEYLSEAIPEASFERGSAVRDFAVSAFTYIFAYLRGEIDRVALRQSVFRIQEEEFTDEDDIAQAVDEVLSNWFLTRRTGQVARVTAQLRFTEKVTVPISLSTRFWRTQDAAFYVDSDTEPYVIPDTSMTPVFDSTGAVQYYVVNVPLRAARVGTHYNIEPGTFYRVEAPSGGLPYFSGAYNLVDIDSGKDDESTEEFIERSRTAISVRNLINNRSCDATLKEDFPEIIQTLTVGMGEPEMQRDLFQPAGSHLQLHVGGHFDTYVDLPLTEVEEQGLVGGYYTKPDGIVNIFRDPSLTTQTGRDFISLGVYPGYVINIRSGVMQAPRAFVITEVQEHALIVSPRTPFPEETIDPVAEPLTYSIGRFAPDFDDLDLDPTASSEFIRQAAVSGTDPDMPVGCSSQYQQSGQIVLTSGRPVQDILSVEITDPSDDDIGDGLVDPASGTIGFGVRTNQEPLGPPVTLLDLEYQFKTVNYKSAQSAEALNIIDVGMYPTESARFDGQTLRVTYKTLRNFLNVDAYVRDQDRRVTNANHLVRGRNPIWMSMTIPYKMKPTASDTELDTTTAAAIIAAYINSFDPSDDLDMSDIATQFRNNFPDVGRVYPFTIQYDLYSPDGQVVEFATEDVVSIMLDPGNGVSLVNGGDILPPPEMVEQGVLSIQDAIQLRWWFTMMGISDRTVKYRTDSSRIQFLLQG